jgi:hypothetical protein
MKEDRCYLDELKPHGVYSIQRDAPSMSPERRHNSLPSEKVKDSLHGTKAARLLRFLVGSVTKAVPQLLGLKWRVTVSVEK